MGRQIEYTINSLKPPVIGGKHSFSFVSLLLRIGITRIDQVLNRDQLEHFTNVLETYDATARSFYDEVHCKIATVVTMNSKIFKEPTSIFNVSVHVIPQIISVFLFYLSIYHFLYLVCWLLFFLAQQLPYLPSDKLHQLH